MKYRELLFWATWCPPCREEIPYLNELYKKHKEDGLVVVGIALDRGGPKEVQKFLEKYRIEYINLLGDEGVLEAFNNIPGMGLIQGIPTTFLIDRKGQICRRFVGLREASFRRGGQTALIGKFLYKEEDACGARFPPNIPSEISDDGSSP